MTGDPYEVILHTLDPASPRESTLPDLDRKPDPWESSTQATCECLSWRGTLDNLTRRHAEDALGESIYRDFPVRARSLIVTAHTMLDRGLISPEELRTRMETIRDRFNRE
ncbi:ScnB [Nocardia sp. NPDC005366]|uniref:ScnB n=1 Tax=Nocardia sp. NPDC005366 TaxID=3156878 RepID=UPI00339E37F2